jgi:cytochrome oxidase Cu insertion factor (SCO1/SenC/PrrC family)
VYSAVDRLDTVSHTDRIFLIDPSGDWRVLYRSDVEPAVLVADVRAVGRIR